MSCSFVQPLPDSVCYRVEDGAQDDLVRAALQNDLHVPLQEPRFGEEFGFCCKRLGCFRPICFPLERRTLWAKTEKNNLCLNERLSELPSWSIAPTLNDYLLQFTLFNLQTSSFCQIITLIRCHLPAPVMCNFSSSAAKHERSSPGEHLEMDATSSGGRRAGLVILSGSLAKLSWVKAIDGGNLVAPIWQCQNKQPEGGE